MTLWITKMQDMTSERSSVPLQNIRSASENLEELRVVLKEEETLKKLLQLF